MTSDNRRPLASRGSAWAHWLTRHLARTAITPNQVSGASVIMALIAALAFWGSGAAEGAWRAGLLICAAMFCQLRLLCNLLDGMLAIEAAKPSRNGAYWNEIPDRVADMLILVSVGLAVGAPALGWAAAALAVLTAYIRVMGEAHGAGSDFRGPMAKPHRMALLTGGALVSLTEPTLAAQGTILTAALWVLTILTAATVLRRLGRLFA